MYKRIIILVLIALLAVVGCTISEEDFARQSNSVSSNNRNINKLSAELKDLQKKIEQSKLRDIQLEGMLTDTRRLLPDMRLEFDELRAEMQRLTNTVELGQRRNAMGSEDAKTLQKELNFIKRRLDRLEATLALPPLRTGAVIAPSQDGAESTGSETAKPEDIQTEDIKPDDTRKVREKPDAKVEPANSTDLYELAQTMYKKKLYKAARLKFLELLEKYPDSEEAPSAQFYSGECLYQQKDYEEAILEYQKVIKLYGKSPRVSNALLKQAFSFYNIDDSISHKLLLQKLVKEHPDSYSAGVARKRLKNIQ